MQRAGPPALPAFSLPRAGGPRGSRASRRLVPQGRAALLTRGSTGPYQRPSPTLTDYPCASEGSPASGICCDDRENPPTHSATTGPLATSQVLEQAVAQHLHPPGRRSSRGLTPDRPPPRPDRNPTRGRAGTRPADAARPQHDSSPVRPPDTDEDQQPIRSAD